MNVFRIASTEHIRDLSGIGARLYGGRWNKKGVSVVYTSESKSLATVEYLVHVPIAIRPVNLSLACIDIPEDLVPDEIFISNLPEYWREYPAPVELAQIGSEWAEAKRSLLLKVPSVVVEGEYNILINPNHPDLQRVTIAYVEEYRFDPRLLR